MMIAQSQKGSLNPAALRTNEGQETTVWGLCKETPANIARSLPYRTGAADLSHGEERSRSSVEKNYPTGSASAVLDSDTPSNFWPLRAEGITATRLTIPMIRNVVCMGPTNRAMLETFEPVGVTPAKTSWRTFKGMLVAKTTNTMERLRSAPVVTSAADIPEATPLLATGVAFMIELMFGATNIPPPTPLTTMSNARTRYEASPGTIEKPNSAADDIKSPPVVKPLAPYLSERKPLKGPTVTKATANGIRRMPAVSAS